MLYPGDRFRTADELLETYLRQPLESQRTPEEAAAWQGGESTMMGLNFFRHSLELVERLRKSGQHVSYTIQTNGTMIDEQSPAFFKENEFLVGFSVDGPRPLHDAYRVDKHGLGSFDRVVRGWEALRVRDLDVAVSVLCAVHAANTEHPLDVYRFFRDDMGVRFIHSSPS